MRMTVIGLAGALLVGGSALAAPSIFVTREPVRVERVSFADLNLGTVPGQLALDSRIRAAARDVCSRDGERSVEALSSAHSCYTAAVATARHDASQVGVGNHDVALNGALVTVRGK